MGLELALFRCTVPTRSIIGATYRSQGPRMTPTIRDLGLCCADSARHVLLTSRLGSKSS